VKKAPANKASIESSAPNSEVLGETTEAPIIQAVLAEISTSLVEQNQEAPAQVESAIETLTTPESTPLNTEIETPNTNSEA
jgi:hypothetical protein